MDAANLLTRLAELIDAHDWDGRFHLEDLVGDGRRAVARGRVVGTAPDGADQVFAVASFATADGGLITELTEVWTDVDQRAPDGTRP